MFDTMTLTKAFSGFCAAFLVFLLGGFAAEKIYGEGHHSDDHHAAYVIEIEDDGAEEVVAEGPPFEELLAMADVDAGGTLFQRNCASCHKIADGENGAGPHLYNIVGRDVASVDGFSYSGNLIAVVDVWTAEELNAFIENPSGYAPRTAMGYGGMRDVEDRANLIAWLEGAGG